MNGGSVNAGIFPTNPEFSETLGLAISNAPDADFHMWYIRLTETGATEQHQWGWSAAPPADNQLRINGAFGFK